MFDVAMLSSKPQPDNENANRLDIRLASSLPLMPQKW